MSTFVEGHNDLVVFDLDLSGNIQQVIKEHFRGGVVVVFGEMAGEQAI